jgi:hypothetical protein
VYSIAARAGHRLHESDKPERVEKLLGILGHAAFIVDEAVTLTDRELLARAKHVGTDFPICRYRMFRLWRRVGDSRLEGVSLLSVPSWSVVELSRRTHMPESEVRPMLERFVALGILLEIAPGEYVLPDGDDDKADVLAFFDDD